MNIYGSLMDIFDQKKNKDILDEKKTFMTKQQSITILPCHLIW